MTNNPSTVEQLNLQNQKTNTGGWRPVAGFTWELFFIALVWAMSFAAIPFLLFRIMHGAHLSALSWTVFWGCFGLAYKLTAWLSDRYRKRQRNVLLSAQDLLIRDTRPHVLYLRSFKDDEITSRQLNLSTEEQELAVVMLEFGPFIAFGEPGEKSAAPGAARMYVDEEHWQDRIKALIADAQLVVARISNSKSFWWEMLTVIHLNRPERLLLLLPADKETYEEFRLIAQNVFPCTLPCHELPSSPATFESHISSKGLIYFEPDWTPHMQKLDSSNLRQTYWAPGEPTFKMALRPVYEQLGIEWTRPPLKLLQIIPLVMLLLFAVFTVYVLVMELLKLLELIRSH